MSVLVLTRADRTSSVASDDNNIYGASTDEELFGFGGADSIAGNDGNDTLHGGGGHDLLLGGKGQDELRGGTGRDTIFGGQGDDALYGGAGADRLSGDFGQDTLVGGSGDDTFAFVKRTADAIDTIQDFTDGDIVELKGFTGLGGASIATTVDGDAILTVDGVTVAILEDAAATFDLGDIVFV